MARSHSTSPYNLSYPVRGGCVEDWDSMERMWQSCIFQYMRCEPENHYFVLTEPPMNTPENREVTAEIMFETFSVPGLYIAVQAVLALAASWIACPVHQRTLTGVVIDSGDGLTHIIPVAEGYVIPSQIRQMPIAGREVTLMVNQLLKDRREPVPPAEALEVARRVKEDYGYVCQDVVKEFGKFDQDPAKYFKKLSGTRGSKSWSIDVGYERFLAPEVFFNPELCKPDFTQTLPELVDETISTCPIDVRRQLYNNIVLSGGSTMFKHFGRRLQRAVKDRVDVRQQGTVNAAAASTSQAVQSRAVDVKVVSHHMQRYAVWFGGSMLGVTPELYRVSHTKAQYDEEGPRIARHNAVFSSQHFG
uniref:Actin-related protein 3 n=2 Tax=Fibrocapsa japonica TaxID=94617 RepID=A0A7S2UYZ9_9STRA